METSRRRPPVPVPPLDYHYLRLVASWASGLRDEPILFEYRPDDLRLVPRVNDAPDTVFLPAETRDPARKEPLLELRMELPDAAPVSALQWGADAVFWSEAAVEKFLVPYYASCAGAYADTFLHDLLGAWNHAPPGVDVVALMHRFTPPPGEPLTLHGMVGVVFVHRGASHVWSLRQFLEAFPRSERTPGPACGEVPDASPGVPAHAAHLPRQQDLRAIAEWASSIRGTPVYFVYDTRTGKYSLSARVPAPGSDRIVVPACTPAMVPGRTAPSAVWIRPRSGRRHDLTRAPASDAVFWTTAAVEQFILPYYASTQASWAAGAMQAILDAWVRNERPAPPSTEAGPAAGHGGQARAAAQEVYALTHLPKSDWVGLEETAAFMPQLGVVHSRETDAEGQRILEVAPFSLFLAPAPDPAAEAG